MTSRRSRATAALAAVGIAVAIMGASPAHADSHSEGGTPFQVPVNVNNPCAVFNAPTANPAVTRITYGEPVNLLVDGTVKARIETERGVSRLKFEVDARGTGTGATSGITYRLDARLVVRAATNSTTYFKGDLYLDARLKGDPRTGTGQTPSQKAQDNVTLKFKVSVTYNNGAITPLSLSSSFSLKCSASPWTDQMASKVSGTNTPVGRGFGDVWNKYAWSMKDFNGGLLVGTKNAFFDYNALQNPTPLVQGCEANPALALPAIYKGLACLELFDSGTAGTPTSAAADTRYAEIWRYDYRYKTWSKKVDSTNSQGFRIMQTHDSALYAGSDLGSFVMGINLGSWNGQLAGDARWDFPGVQVMKSTDGKSFAPIASCAVSGPCATTRTQAANSGNTNVSIRSMASFNGKLYVGTFNVAGGELWSYDSTNDTWALVKKFSKTGVTTLAVLNGKLIIGLGGNVDQDYLYQYPGVTPPCAPTAQCIVPTADPTLIPNLPSAVGTLGVLELFTSSKGLFVGLADVAADDANSQAGFQLFLWNGTGDGSNFSTLTTDGFGNSANAYPWSMNEYLGRIYLGTFSEDILGLLPRGSAELFYSDDAVNWQQKALPVSFGLWNYGIRTIEKGTDGNLYFGTASAIIAPDFQPAGGDLLAPLTPGAEVWSVKSNTP